MTKVFVDGRNVQRSQWPNLSDEDLLERCRDWAERHGHEVVLVFDGEAPAGAIGSGGESADDWIARAQSSGIRMLQDFAKTLAAHRSGILNYYKCRITTAALEGTNNKIKTMQRQAYGFRDHEFFKLKILAIHETKYALVG